MFISSDCNGFGNMRILDLYLPKLLFQSMPSIFTEFQNLKSYLGRMRIYRFRPESFQQKAQIMDGGIAIIDQIICSHAKYGSSPKHFIKNNCWNFCFCRHFIGTYESTFTYRIYEEREILGFPKDATFNTFCKNDDLSNCEKNSVWPIVF